MNFSLSLKVKKKIKSTTNVLRKIVGKFDIKSASPVITEPVIFVMNEEIVVPI